MSRWLACGVNRARRGIRACGEIRRGPPVLLDSRAKEGIVRELRATFRSVISVVLPGAASPGAAARPRAKIPRSVPALLEANAPKDRKQQLVQDRTVIDFSPEIERSRLSFQNASDPRRVMSQSTVDSVYCCSRTFTFGMFNGVVDDERCSSEGRPDRA